VHGNRNFDPIRFRAKIAIFDFDSNIVTSLKTVVCRGCVNAVTGTGLIDVDIGVDANLELVDKFCFLG